MSQLLSRWAVTIRDTSNEPTVNEAVGTESLEAFVDGDVFGGGIDDELGDLF